MIRDLHATAIILPLLVVACGGPSPEAKEPSAPPPAIPSAAPVATVAPSATPSAAPTAAPTAAPAPSASTDDVDGPDGIRRWASWSGPKSGVAITAKRAWAVIPNMSGDGADSFAAVALAGPFDVIKGDATEVVYENRKHKLAISAALARPAQAPTGLTRGAAVRCAFGGSTVVAHVEATSAKETTCAFRFMGKTRKEKVKPDEVYPLSGKLDLGAPVIVRFEGDTDASYLGMVLAVSGEDAWVTVETQFGNGDPRANHFVHKVKTAGLEAIDLARPLKVGDPCRATRTVRIDACKVTKVIDGGVGYVVAFDDGERGLHEEWALGEVAPVAKAKKP